LDKSASGFTLGDIGMKPPISKERSENFTKKQTHQEPSLNLPLLK